MFDFTGSYTDQYQLTMAQVYFLKGHTNTAVFDYFFRKLPFNSGYAVFAGLSDLLDILENYHFNDRDLHFLQDKGMHPEFLNYLKNFRFKGTVYAHMEGDIVFPTSPIVTIEANIIEAQLIETILLNLLNFQTLIATKASRIRHVSGDCKLVDFGLRRAQGPGVIMPAGQRLLVALMRQATSAQDVIIIFPFREQWLIHSYKVMTVNWMHSGILLKYGLIIAPCWWIHTVRWKAVYLMQFA